MEQRKSTKVDVELSSFPDLTIQRDNPDISIRGRYFIAGLWRAPPRSTSSRQPPLVEFVPQPGRGVLSEGQSDDENEVGSPGVVMAFAASAALERLTRFPSRVKVGSHDVRQLVKARMLASTRVPSIIRADLHPPLRCVGAAAASAADDAYRVSV